MKMQRDSLGKVAFMSVNIRIDVKIPGQLRDHIADQTEHSVDARVSIPVWGSLWTPLMYKPGLSYRPSRKQKP